MRNGPCQSVSDAHVLQVGSLLLLLLLLLSIFLDLRVDARQMTALHSLLSSVFLKIPSNVSPVHAVMLFIMMSSACLLPVFLVEFQL